MSSMKERKEKYRQVISLLEEGHTTTSASKIVGYSQPQISRIAKSLGFRKREKIVEQILIGKVKASLIKRAIGYKTTKKYQQIDKSGNVVDLIEQTEVTPDVKAQLAFLQAKDKEGGWINNSTNNIININQSMQSISTEDLLLTLRTAPEQLKAGGEGGVGVSVESKEKLPPTEYDYYDLKNLDNPKDWVLEPTEGMLDNLGEEE